jgi:hypothetical protein
MHSGDAVRFTTLDSNRVFTLLAQPVCVLRHKSTRSQGAAHTSKNSKAKLAVMHKRRAERFHAYETGPQSGRQC